MGKKSIKPDKNIFFQAREDADMTRAQAGSMSEWLSESKIEKIENDKMLPDPEEVLEMARIYNKPILCNQYCARMCRIGEKYVPEIRMTDLSQIVLSMLSSLNSINQDKDRIIDIVADGEVNEDEVHDFYAIKDKLEKISQTADALRIWVDSMEASGKLENK